jgi:ABC-type nickel/cobalt efflux system permease component RcnA
MPDISTLNSFQLLEYGAWALCVLFGLWMLFDTIKTDMAYSDDVLISSREGEIDDALVIDPTHQGGHR